MCRGPLDEVGGNRQCADKMGERQDIERRDKQRLVTVNRNSYVPLEPMKVISKPAVCRPRPMASPSVTGVPHREHL